MILGSPWRVNEYSSLLGFYNELTDMLTEVFVRLLPPSSG
jgi:hypothetical protein